MNSAAVIEPAIHFFQEVPFRDFFEQFGHLKPPTVRSPGRIDFPTEPRLGGMRVLRVEMQMFHDAPAPTRNRLSSWTGR